MSGLTRIPLASKLSARFGTSFLGAQDKTLGAAADVAVLLPRPALNARLLRWFMTCHPGAEGHAIPTRAPVTVLLPGGVPLTLRLITLGTLVQTGLDRTDSPASSTGTPVTPNTPTRARFALWVVVGCHSCQLDSPGSDSDRRANWRTAELGGAENCSIVTATVIAVFLP